jgi:hypothetical protein
MMASGAVQLDNQELRLLATHLENGVPQAGQGHDHQLDFILAACQAWLDNWLNNRPADVAIVTDAFIGAQGDNVLVCKPGLFFELTPHGHLSSHGHWPPLLRTRVL